MDDLKTLVGMLKVIGQNIQILHRHLIDNRAWFANHEQLNTYYDKVQSDLDDLAEILDLLNGVEPTMSEALNEYNEIEVKDREIGESYNMVREFFNDIVIQINRIEDVPEDIINKLQEYQEYYRKEADYKLKRALGGE